MSALADAARRVIARWDADNVDDGKMEDDMRRLDAALRLPRPEPDGTVTADGPTGPAGPIYDLRPPIDPTTDHLASLPPELLTDMLVCAEATKRWGMQHQVNSAIRLLAALARIPEMTAGGSECGYAWGDFRCRKHAGHDDAHALVWDGDDDDE